MQTKTFVTAAALAAYGLLQLSFSPIAFATLGAPRSQWSQRPNNVVDSPADCHKFSVWYGHQGPLPENFRVARSIPKVPDQLVISFKHASAFRDPNGAGSGACPAVWYDPVHRLAAIMFFEDTVLGTKLLKVKTPIPWVARRNLADIQSRDGIRIGMSLREVQQKLGNAKIFRVGNTEMLHYSWSKPMPGYPQALRYYTFVVTFTSGRLSAMSYSSGV
ncbi:MAG: hypothetical protein PXZ07_02960 [Candidatus Eremiobacteraeota bacterium]|nr:hypothetical protein [Candidatus Eremiobacteraeota bacterium]